MQLSGAPQSARPPAAAAPQGSGTAGKVPHFGPGARATGSGIQARLPHGPGFTPGEMLHGHVAGREGALFLLHLGGRTLQAQTRLPLSVGQSLQVQVEGQRQGQVHLRVVQSPFIPMSSADLTEALTQMRLPVTDANMALARAMVEYQVPLTRENFLKLQGLLARTAAEGGATAPSAPSPQATSARVGAVVFLQANSLPLTPQNVAVLGNFIAAHPQLAQQMLALQKELRRIVESPAGVGRRGMEALARVPGLLAEYILDSRTRGDSKKAARRLFELAKQAGIEPRTALSAGAGDPDWDLLELMRQLRGRIEGEGGLTRAAELMRGLEENLQAHQLINQAHPESRLGYYYLQVPLRPDDGQAAEIWIRYHVEDGCRRVDADNAHLEFTVTTEHLGELHFVLEVVERTAHVRMGTPCEEVRRYAEPFMAVLAERIASLGWRPGRVEAVALMEDPKRPLVARNEFEQMERVYVEA